jgi:hypothetical protein
MTTAKKIDHTFSVLTPVVLDQSKQINRINPLLRESKEIFELMGWGELSDEVKYVIAIDLIGFRDELKGLYSTNSLYVLARRKSIYYWINMLLNDACSEKTAIDALKIGQETMLSMKAI